MKPVRWQFVQYQLRGKVYAARIVDTYPNSSEAGVRVFFPEKMAEQSFRAYQRYSPTPAEGCWSPVPEVRACRR